MTLFDLLLNVSQVHPGQYLIRTAKPLGYLGYLGVVHEMGLGLAS